MKEQKITVYTLAKELGMSIAAISRAFDPHSKLSDEKRKMILEVAEKRGYRPNRMASRLSMEPVRIGVLNYSFIKAYYSDLVDGIKLAYAKLKDYKVECDMRILQRGTNSMEEALAVLDEFYALRYDGVIVSGIYEPCVVEKINRLSDAGISVATLQYNLENSKRVFASLGNYQVIGEMAAQLCGMLLRNAAESDVVMFTGNKASPTHQLLTDSFLNASLKNGFRVVGVYDTRDVAECAAEMAVKAFSEHPNLAAIYASSANSLPICRYLEQNQLGGKVAFVASDIFEELYPYLNQGYINATIWQDPTQMGYRAFDELYHVIADKKKVPEVIYSVPSIVLSSNLRYYKKTP